MMGRVLAGWSVRAIYLLVGFAFIVVAALYTVSHASRGALADPLPVMSAADAVNGPLLMAASQGAPGARETVLAVNQGQAPRILISHLPAGIGIGASPRGRYVALAEGKRGLWLVKTNGKDLYRRLLPPPPTQHVYPLTIAAVAWAPDRYTLAYIVGEDLSTAKGPGPVGFAADAHVGVWVARYDGGPARQIATDKQLGDVLFGLSWSSDGRTIAVIGDGVTQVIDVTTGRVRWSVEGPGAFAPTSPMLAYVGDACDPGATGSAFCVVTAQGEHRGRQRVVGHDTAQGSSPATVVWSPDGHNLAYVVSTLEIHTLNIGTGRVQVVRLGPPWRLNEVGGAGLAWQHTPV